MTDERKKELGYKLLRLADELEEIVRETKIDISLMSIYMEHFDKSWIGNSYSLHYYDNRMVSIDDKDELKKAFFIERDDTVRKEKSDEENNTEE